MAASRRRFASPLMDHKTPEYRPAVASITLRRYTHTLPGALERARPCSIPVLASSAADP
jgi:hypothetical protein